MAHFFTPEEANKKLPEVRKLLLDTWVEEEH